MADLPDQFWEDAKLALRPANATGMQAYHPGMFEDGEFTLEELVDCVIFNINASGICYVLKVEYEGQKHHFLRAWPVRQSS